MSVVRSAIVVLLAAVAMNRAAAMPLPGCQPEDLHAVPVHFNVDFDLQVQPIFTAACAGCHGGASAAGGLNLEPGHAYEQLVGIAAANGAAARPRVSPGNAAASFLFRKINCTGLNELTDQPYGRRMPRNGPPWLDPADQAVILDWIEQGSSATAHPELIWSHGFEGRQPPPFEGSFGTLTVIDDGDPASGIRSIVTADLDGSGHLDVIVAQPFHIDEVAVWTNLGNGTFSDKIVVDNSRSDPVYVATGDFNGDGRPDLAAITQTDGELVWYPNLEDGFGPGISIDQNRFFGNALVVGDFDSSGRDDIVAIGQHSIDLFRNHGQGEFTKEPILTTDTSPNVLECLHIEAADMTGNGHLDLVVAETIGGVIYVNDGKGVFTPQVFTSEGFIVRSLHVFDATGNGLPDVVLQTSPGSVNLYVNNGNGGWSLTKTLFHAIAPIRSFQSVDVDGDGLLDLYVAHGQSARIYRNLGGGEFTGPYVVDESPELFIDEVAVADLDGSGRPQLIWSAVNGRLAYRRLEPAARTRAGRTSSTSPWPPPAQ